MTDERRKNLNQQRIAKLTPELQEIVEDGIEALEKDGFRPYITQGFRSIDEQEALYLQGRRPLEVVNAARRKVGWDDLSLSSNEKIVTRARGTASKHCLGKAFDMVNLNDDGEIEWEDMTFYRSMALYFEQHGLSWGGDWSWRDYAHCEID